MDLKTFLKPYEPYLPYLVMVVGLVSAALFVWYFAAETDRRKRTAGTLLAIILTGFSVFCIMLGLKKGIDLQGGASFLVRVVPAEGRTVSPDALRRAQEILEKRLNPAGARDVTITPQGEDRLYVEVPGLNDDEIRESRAIIERPAKLEFRLLSPRGLATVAPDDPTIEVGYEKMPYRDRSPEEEAAAGTQEDAVEADDTSNLPRVFVKNRPELSGRSVKKAFAALAPGSINYHIVVELHDEFGEKMREITAANKGQPLAIVLDDVVISAPRINGVFGSNFEITGNFTEKEARDLASALENPLENSLSVEQSSTTSPTYGEETIRQGLYSCYAGLAATLAFMILYYRLSGFIAVVGLVVNLLLLLGAMQVFGFTLTMPGIAGIILTVGMAVDANVLIYERMREEFERGRTIHTAIGAAYEKAFSAIFDANITTLITSVIMIFIASGAVRGFGLSLAIGLTASMFSALLITRVCYMWLDKIGLKQLSFMNLIRNPRFDFMGKRKLCFVLSAILIGGSLVAMAVAGKRALGYELRGGDAIGLRSVPGLTTAEVESSLSDFSAEVNGQKFDASSLNVQSVHPLGGSELINIRSAPDTADAILAELTKDLGDDPERAAAIESADIQKMGSAVGENMLWRSVWALVLGLVGIFIYVTVRFEFPFALGAIVALIHDVIVAIAACVIAGKEIGLILVGAFLTVAGFSINDTIVIFDRVRENLRTARGELEEILNDAINATLSRTIITTFTTALAVLAMYVFGGKSMADFSFAMLIGMISGVYSTVFIAAPVVVSWAKFRKLNLRKQILDADAARLEALSGIEREVVK